MMTPAALGGPQLRTFSVQLAGPLDLDRSLGFLQRNGDDLLDRWDGRTLRRVLHLAGRPVPTVMRPAGDRRRPGLRVTALLSSPLLPLRDLRAAVAGQFVTAPDAWENLCRRDPDLAALDAQQPGIRPLTLTDPFYSLVRSISAQQVNLRWAVTLRARLVGLVGTRCAVGDQTMYYLEPARLAGLAVADLRQLQFSTRKAEYLITVAEAAASGRLDTDLLASEPDGEVIRQLTALRGVGRWTAEWMLSRVLRRPIVVAGDLVVRKVVGRLYRTGSIPTETETRRLTAHWGPAAAIAQQLALETMATPGSDRANAAADATT